MVFVVFVGRISDGQFGQILRQPLRLSAAFLSDDRVLRSSFHTRGRIVDVQRPGSARFGPLVVHCAKASRRLIIAALTISTEDAGSEGYRQKAKEAPGCTCSRRPCRPRDVPTEEPDEPELEPEPENECVWLTDLRNPISC